MQTRLKGAWIVALGVVLCGPILCAQVPEKPPTHAKHSQNNDDWSYRSPGQKKCVEVGNFYLHQGDLKAALSRFQEAVKDDPHYALAYLGLGKTYERMKEDQKALAAYKRYLDELPSARDAAGAKDAHRAIARLQRHP